MWMNMSLDQLDSVIAEANCDEPQSGAAKGLLDARGLVASELKLTHPTDEDLLKYIEESIEEALAWKTRDLEKVLVGTYGGPKLAELTGVDVWTHGNLWREDRALTQEICRWFAAYTDSHVAELRKILSALAGTFPS
jgi:hypothetical protein